MSCRRQAPCLKAAEGWHGAGGCCSLALQFCSSAVLRALRCFLLPWRFCTDGKLRLETLGYFGVILEDWAVPLQK